MSEHINLRLTLVLVILFGALATVFSPLLVKLRHPSEKVNEWVKLNPGIDMVGGTSLVYEIKKPEGAHSNGHLASDVAEALKKRVDPTGVKNLVWRPQGDTRLEIQMPLASDSKQSAEQRRTVREGTISAQDALEATNVRSDAVIDAIENKNGRTQADLPKLAGDSRARQALFNDLKDLWNRMEAAKKAHDAEAAARLSNEFEDKLHPKTAQGMEERNPIEDTNLDRTQLEEILNTTDTAPDAPKDVVDANGKSRAESLDVLYKKYADFPSRVAAIKNYVAAHAQLKDSSGILDSSTDLKRLLKGAGVLEYHILMATSDPEYQTYVQRLHADGPRVRAGDVARWFEVDRPEGLGSLTETYNNKHWVLGYITPSPDGKPRSLDAHSERAWHLTDAKEETQSMSGEKVVEFQFDPQGGVYFGELTGANVGKPMAIVLDGKVISAPNINSKITFNGIIEGGHNGFKSEELEYLVNTLKAGSLPATLSDEPISERTVGPQLGQDNLRRGLVACGLGMVVVAVFLCGYYFLAGFVATCAVVMNVLLVLAVMAFFNATFTLPSIAGIVLSVGTAVDANVLIFERLREEQHRGLSLRLALRNAYGKAFSAILDSNMTTAITSVFLIWFGTEEVKGFGVTVIIGIIASLFTALFVTRTVFTWLMENFGVSHLRSIPLVFPKLDKALRPNIDWMGKAWIFISFSVIGIVVGLILFVVQVRKGQMMGIEFASGTSVEFELSEPMPQAKVRDIVEKKADPVALPSPSVVTVGTDEKTYEIVTPNSNAVQVREAVISALKNEAGQTLLKTDVPSKFDGSGAKLGEEAASRVVIPLEDKKTPDKSAWPGGFRPENVREFEPGVAVVLNHLDPPLSPAQIYDRIRQTQLQLPSGSAAAALDFTVDSPQHNASSPTSVAVVMCRNDALPASKDEAKWRESLAGPLWQLVNDSVNRPAQLQQVKNFDAQVAADATHDALMALVLSIMVIMAYIWFRFGNLKYGTATMVALVHDVLFTVAALGFSHYLWQVPGIGSIFQLEPFRIDLTVVAGILTIMGYSMIDTIVVFDRIRENRGKFGTVSRHVVNDAINQTLSRTLLTAGTNVITVAIMYFLGGPGIHGFTFVLLIGILVGTYSSVAIAAPILLLGGQEETVTGGVRGRARPAGA